jgi:hypothetical protein
LNIDVWHSYRGAAIPPLGRRPSLTGRLGLCRRQKSPEPVTQSVSSSSVRPDLSSEKTYWSKGIIRNSKSESMGRSYAVID